MYTVSMRLVYSSYTASIRLMLECKDNIHCYRTTSSNLCKHFKTAVMFPMQRDTKTITKRASVFKTEVDMAARTRAGTREQTKRN